jgi:hypothetical protein
MHSPSVSVADSSLSEGAYGSAVDRQLSARLLTTVYHFFAKLYILVSLINRKGSPLTANRWRLTATYGAYAP